MRHALVLAIDVPADRVTEVTLRDCSSGIAHDRAIFEEIEKK